ncbi:hypothetical protein [Lentzea sp. NPDC004782]|uniref:hypothetical protein n=1 Tax=Lentzea sp. NPDC004782 TaxID=3154458 RepID=UPI0033B71A20
MRALWAAGGSAVLGSAFLGVLVGMAIHGVSDEDPLTRTPASTWIRSTPNSTPSAPPESSISPSSEPPSSDDSAPATQQPPKKTTTPPPAAINPAAPPPPVATTTPPPQTSGWPCSPLNPLPPPTCKNMGN